MPRTMSQEEHEQFNNYTKQKSRELTEKEESITFLQNIGYCDKHGKIMFPYNSTKKQK